MVQCMQDNIDQQCNYFLLCMVRYRLAYNTYIQHSMQCTIPPDLEHVYSTAQCTTPARNYSTMHSSSQKLQHNAQHQLETTAQCISCGQKLQHSTMYSSGQKLQHSTMYSGGFKLRSVTCYSNITLFITSCVHRTIYKHMRTYTLHMHTHVHCTCTTNKSMIMRTLKQHERGTYYSK